MSVSRSDPGCKLLSGSVVTPGTFVKVKPNLPPLVCVGSSGVLETSSPWYPTQGKRLSPNEPPM